MAPRNATEVRIVGKDQTAAAFKSLHNKLNGLSQRMDRFNRSSRTAAAGLGGFTGAVTGVAVVGGLNELATGLKRSIDALDTLNDMSIRTV